MRACVELCIQVTPYSAQGRTVLHDFQYRFQYRYLGIGAAQYRNTGMLAILGKSIADNRYRYRRKSIADTDTDTQPQKYRDTDTDTLKSIADSIAIDIDIRY